jgi:hypothetical protein
LRGRCYSYHFANFEHFGILINFLIVPCIEVF